MLRVSGPPRRDRRDPWPAARHWTDSDQPPPPQRRVTFPRRRRPYSPHGGGEEVRHNRRVSRGARQQGTLGRTGPSPAGRHGRARSPRRLTRTDPLCNGDAAAWDEALRPGCEPAAAAAACAVRSRGSPVPLALAAGPGPAP